MRGLTRNQEQKTSRTIRDTRTIGEKFSAFLRHPNRVALAILCAALITFAIPGLFDVILLTCMGFFIASFSKKATLPFMMPKRSHVVDYNNISPSGKPQRSEGIFYFGNELKTNKELWFSDTDMRTHCLIFGSTGSGKTFTLCSIAFNALAQSSGFIYVDGKGDNLLFSMIFSMVRSVGREDDLLAINFMTGARDIIGRQKKKLSNTLNPFSKGSSGMLSNLIASMMDSSNSSSGDGDMWKGRAIAFVEALMRILVYMRDKGYILLDANIIRNYFTLDRIEAMVESKTFIRDDQYNISLEDCPSVVLEPIKNYLYQLPGYNPERKGKQVSQVFEQHGYITMQLTRVFTSLADTYGHILRVKQAEVDFKDVVLNRRILAVLLPSLEKSPDELANLGKIIISTLKAMMAAGLGEDVEGKYSDLIESKPTNSDTPFLCILDEYGYYAVKGFAVVPAQARSLGFSTIFAGQDLPAFQKASKEEAASIGANTNIKICMKLEDPTETWDFFNKSAGEAYVTQVESFSSQGSGMSSSYQDTKGAKLEKRSRIDLQDLKEQGVGEFHIFFRSTIVRGKSFFANPQPTKAIRLNHFLRVDLPKDLDLYTFVKGIEDAQMLEQTGNYKRHGNVPQSMNDLAKMFDEIYQEDKLLDPIGRSVVLIQRLIYDSKQTREADTQDAAGAFEVASADSVNVFQGLPAEYVESLPLPIANREAFRRPFIDQQLTFNNFKALLLKFGCSDIEAETIAHESIKDISRLSHYQAPEFETVLVTEITEKFAEYLE